MQTRPQKRDLTTEERNVLRDIRLFWGPQNTEVDVFVTDRNEAAIFVRDRDGNSSVCVVLSNLASWLANGTYSRADYYRSIMGPVAQDHSTLYAMLVYYAARLRGLALGWDRDA